ncbi:uncharacterized protein BT62DRAFT_910087, partial [Guyanagaster necrorhizus]
EDMEHIMTVCSSTGQKEVWKLTEKLLEKHGILCQHTLSMTNILACAIPVFKAPNRNRDRRKEWFYDITISLSMQVIWNAQYERVIQNHNTPFSPVQMQNRWWKRVQNRLDLDRLMMHKWFGKKALQKALVIKTWSGMMDDEHQLLEDWTEADRVLVGKE